MEVFGGNGYVEDGPMARLFREAPVNSIWEGSGNVMCLDMLRAVAREPVAAFALLDRLGATAPDDPAIAREAAALRDMLGWAPTPLEAAGRLFAQRLILLVQACLLRESAPDVRGRRIHRDAPEPAGCGPCGGRDRWDAHRHRGFAGTSVSRVRPVVTSFSCSVLGPLPACDGPALPCESTRFADKKPRASAGSDHVNTCWRPIGNADATVQAWCPPWVPGQRLPAPDARAASTCSLAGRAIVRSLCPSPPDFARPSAPPGSHRCIAG